MTASVRLDFFFLLRLVAWGRRRTGCKTSSSRSGGKFGHHIGNTMLEIEGIHDRDQD